MQKRMRQIFVVILLVVAILSTTGALSMVNVADAAIAQDAKLEYLEQILSRGYNITAGKELAVKNLKLSILDYSDPKLATFIQTKEFNNVISENSRKSSAIEMAEWAASQTDIGVDAKIMMVNTSINTMFNRNTGAVSVVEEQYDYYYTMIENLEIYINLRPNELRNYLSDRFEQDLYAVNSVEKAKMLLNDYGTHILTGYNLGGTLTVTNYVAASNDSLITGNETSIDQKLGAAVSAFGGGETMSFAEKYDSQFNNNYSVSNYKVQVKGGIGIQSLTIDQLFQYNNAELTGNGNFMYKPWIDAINNGEKLELTSIAENGKAVPIWDLLAPSSKSNMIRRYLLNAFVEMCGDEYDKFINMYPPVSGYFEDEQPTDCKVNITGFYKILNNVVSNVEFAETDVETIIEPSSQIFMVTDNTTELSVGETLDWRVISGEANVTILDDFKGVFEVTPGARGKFTVGCFNRRTNEKYAEWTFNVAPVKYSGGKGTHNSPYLIGTIADMKVLQQTPADWSKHFLLIDDLDFSTINNETGLTAIGSVGIPFDGSFDGNYHTISNFEITERESASIGIFGVLSDYNTSSTNGETGVIKNLKIKNSKVTMLNSANPRANIGILVGSSAGKIENCIIENCSINVTYKFVETHDVSVENPADYKAGMLVGYTNGEIAKCGIVNPVINVDIDSSAHSEYMSSVGNAAATIKKTKYGNNISIGSLVGVVDGGKGVSQCYVKVVTIGSNASKLDAKVRGVMVYYDPFIGNTDRNSWTIANIYVGGLIGSATNTTLTECLVDCPNTIIAEKSVIESFSCSGHPSGGQGHKNIPNVPTVKEGSTSYAGTLIGYVGADVACDKVIAHTVRSGATGTDIVAPVKDGAGFGTIDTSGKKVQYISADLKTTQSNIDATFDVENVWCADESGFPVLVDFAFDNNSITIESTSDTYYQGTHFDVTQFNVLLDIKGTTAAISQKYYKIDYSTFAQTGAFTVYVAGVSKSYKQTVQKCEIEYIYVTEVDGAPTLYQGHTYDHTGRIEVMAILSNGEIIDLLNDTNLDYVNYKELVISSPQLNAGKNKIDVTYGDVEAHYIVEAEKNVVERIDLVNAPTTVRYKVGDTFQSAGMEIAATYSDGNVVTVNNADLEIYGTTIAEGDNEIIVCYANYIALEQPIEVVGLPMIVVTFVDYDDTVISSDEYDSGSTIIVPTDPTRGSDNTYTYTFDGWDKEVSTTATESVTYKATYKAEYINYTIKFVDYNNSVISTNTYHYGEEVEVPADPTRPGYIFTGWDSEVVTCQGNKTYRATYTTETYPPVVGQYTIVFRNYDGTIISTNTYRMGDTVLEPTAPTKPSDERYTYTFAGWDSEVTTCQGNKTYKATYSQQYIEYTIKFVDYNNSVISTQKYHYGDIVDEPTDPVREKEEKTWFTSTVFTFTGWDSEVVNVTEDATYIAQYETHTQTNIKSILIVVAICVAVVGVIVFIIIRKIYY